MSRAAVLAYSGGLDTTCCIAWLKEDYGFDEVVAVLVDVGQDYDLPQAQARGHAAGADDVLLIDRKHEVASDQLAKALRPNALYEGRYPLLSSLSRPVIAAAVASLALELGAAPVVHGGTGAGKDQLRVALACNARCRGARARRAAPRPDAARRRVRDRPDRHHREPRRRDQEPCALRGARGDRPDRGAQGARGPRPDEGRAPVQAPGRGAVDAARLRGA